jgi:hypothetical protein
MQATSTKKYQRGNYMQSQQYIMFYGAATFNLGISNWEISSVRDTHNMFYGATAFNHIDMSVGIALSQINVRNVPGCHCLQYGHLYLTNGFSNECTIHVWVCNFSQTQGE